jgi:hypothetical protein
LNLFGFGVRFQRDAVLLGDDESAESNSGDGLSRAVGQLHGDHFEEAAPLLLTEQRTGAADDDGRGGVCGLREVGDGRALSGLFCDGLSFGAAGVAPSGREVKKII